jgi:hypothetical protein
MASPLSCNYASTGESTYFGQGRALIRTVLPTWSCALLCACMQSMRDASVPEMDPTQAEFVLFVRAVNIPVRSIAVSHSMIAKIKGIVCEGEPACEG